MEKYLTFISLIFILAFLNCTHQTNTVISTPSQQITEIAVQRINLEGVVADRNSEISGLAWYNDYLILLPQYPNRFGNKLFAIPKERLLSYVQKVDSNPITPIEIELESPNFTEEIEGFEGFEAIAFVGDKVFLTIESEPDLILGFIVSGEIESDLSKITINPDKIAEIPPQADIPNASEESIFFTEDRVITIYEGNGKNVNPNPVVRVFDYDLNYLESIPFPNIEYRITDATYLDENNNFWAINYFWPGDKQAYNPADDQIAITYGKGESHSASEAVERLVEFQYTEDKIILLDHEPIQLQLLPDDARNWEGIARLDKLGFIIATDKFPETILGFVSTKL